MPATARRRPGLAAAAAALVLSLATGATGCGRDGSRRLEPPFRPNVLIILVDALRADRLGLNGYPLPTTPNLDRLAPEAVNFTRAFSHSTWTKPSIATLFTSLYPAQHGLDRVGFTAGEETRTDILPESLVTLAEAFKAGGYSTVAVVNQLHLQRRYGFAQGFDSFTSLRLKSAFYLNSRLRDWLAAAGHRPFFAYLHYLDVHWPYDKKHSSNRDLFGDPRIKPDPPRHWDLAEAWARSHLDARTLRALETRYDREVGWTDVAIGELLETLRTLDLWDRTILVVTADHGEGFREHGRLQHGYAPYEELVHVPLLIRLPPGLGLPSGERTDLVGLVDLMPTLLELAGRPVPPQAVGRSLLPLLAGGALAPRPVYIEGEDVVGLRASRYKLLRSEAGAACFDLETDPTEQHPLAEPWPERCGDLERRLARVTAWLEATHAARGEESALMDPRDVEELRSLGYVTQ